MLVELIAIESVAIIVWLYRNYQGENVGKFITGGIVDMYNKFAPYSYKTVREKTKELGQEYSPHQYMVQVLGIGGFTGIVTYLYFYNLLTSFVYILLSLTIIPYLAYLRSKRIYSEFIFEQIQVYTSNVIMEFATTQSFVKSLEGVIQSGLLDDPVKSDVQHMIDLAYDNGTINESIDYMSELYPYYIVKNMHQLFLQITKEGARDSGDSLDNMQSDIDMLIESVYRDRIERASFHKNFLQFGVMLYLMVMLVQYLLGRETYLILLDRWYIQALLHGVLIINTYFLLRGEKYYNENVGAE